METGKFPYFKDLTLGRLLGNPYVQGSNPRAVSPFATSSDFVSPWKTAKKEEWLLVEDLEDACRLNDVRLKAVYTKRSYLWL